MHPFSVCLMSIDPLMLHPSIIHPPSIHQSIHPFTHPSTHPCMHAPIHSSISHDVGRVRRGAQQAQQEGEEESFQPLQYRLCLCVVGYVYTQRSLNRPRHSQGGHSSPSLATQSPLRSMHSPSKHAALLASHTLAAASYIPW